MSISQKDLKVETWERGLICGGVGGCVLIREYITGGDIVLVVCSGAVETARIVQEMMASLYIRDLDMNNCLKRLAKWVRWFYILVIATYLICSSI
ncbi:hypothetical protein YC2023_004916 [Brassica napus]